MRLTDGGDCLRGLGHLHPQTVEWLQPSGAQPHHGGGLRHFVGVAYAIWSGVGIVLISAVGWLWMDQRMDGPALFGLGLIVAGVLVINLLSETVAH